MPSMITNDENYKNVVSRIKQQMQLMKFAYKFDTKHKIHSQQRVHVGVRFDEYS